MNHVRTAAGALALGLCTLLSRAASACPEPAATGTQPCDGTLRGLMASAGAGSLGAAGWGIHQMDYGVGSAVHLGPGWVPCVLMSAVAETESSWHQFGYVACGQSAPTLVSFDCGYGIMQITSGMDGTGGFTPSRVAAEPAYDISVGVNILIQKWQASAAIDPNDPHIAEDWYFALWGYNGFAASNNPNQHADTIGMYFNPGAPAYPRSHYPYEEIVYGYALHPTTGTDGQPRWPSTMITHPNYSEICAACGFPTTSRVYSRPTPEHNGDCSAPAQNWGGQFVAQSFPLAGAGAVMMHPGDVVPAWIEMRNIGTHAWDGNTRLGTTQPRDRTSPIAGADWTGPNRPASATGSVAMGQVFRFNFSLYAPATPGTYDEHLGMLEEGVTWFSDPGQAGPPDDQLELRVIVEPNPPTDAGPPPTDSGRPSSDAAITDVPTVDTGVAPSDSSTPTDARVADAQTSDGSFMFFDAFDDAGSSAAHRGCGCSAPGRELHGSGAWAIALATVGLVRTKRRRPRGAA